MMKIRTILTDHDELSDGRWIIVADADEGAANLLAGYLLRQRFRAYPTGRGHEALRVAEGHPLSLAVIDMELADMAGRGAAMETDARQLGIVQYFQKPFDFRRLELVARRIHAMRLGLAAGVPEE